MNTPFTGKQADVFQWLLLAAGIFIVYKVYKGISNVGSGLGLTSDPQAEAAAKAAESSNYVKPEWVTEVIKRFKGAGVPVTEADAILKAALTESPFKGADSIYKAKSAVRVGVAGLTDDEEKVLNVYRLAGSQFELAAIARAFSSLYNRDLFGYIDTFMSNASIESLHKIAKTKKIYPPAITAAAKKYKVKLPYVK